MIKEEEKNREHWKKAICISAKTTSFDLLNFALEGS